MAQSNKTLHRASKVKNDEFYTRYSDVEKELSNYISQFRGGKYTVTVITHMNRTFVSSSL